MLIAIELFIRRFKNHFCVFIIVFLIMVMITMTAETTNAKSTLNQNSDASLISQEASQIDSSSLSASVSDAKVNSFEEELSAKIKQLSVDTAFTRKISLINTILVFAIFILLILLLIMNIANKRNRREQNIVQRRVNETSDGSNEISFQLNSVALKFRQELEGVNKRIDSQSQIVEKLGKTIENKFDNLSSLINKKETGNISETKTIIENQVNQTSKYSEIVNKYNSTSDLSFISEFQPLDSENIGLFGKETFADTNSIRCNYYRTKSLINNNYLLLPNKNKTVNRYEFKEAFDVVGNTNNQPIVLMEPALLTITPSGSFELTNKGIIK